MSDFQTGVLLGRIMTSQQAMHDDIREIKRSMKDKEHVPRIESWLKSFLTIAAPTATLFATGSVQKALEVLALVAGR